MTEMTANTTAKAKTGGKLPRSANEPVPPARMPPPKTPKIDNRPYTLESSNLESELNRQRLAALSEIESIESSILAIEQTANRDKELIQAKADNEIAARRFRADDLQKIVAMVDKATAPAVQPNDLQPTEWRQIGQIGAPAQAMTKDERRDQMAAANNEALQEAIEAARRSESGTPDK